MKFNLLLSTLLLLAAQGLYAQQDPMFTNYNFNTLIYNPAFAGSKDHMSMTLLHRDQWYGIDGGPTTQTLTIHSPASGNRVGLGGSILHDDIGPTKEIKLSGYYAYRINFNDGKSKLSLGLSGSISNWQADWSELKLDNTADPAFMVSQQRWMPNAGVGVYYHNPYFYMGLSVPNLFNNRFDEAGMGMTGPNDPLQAMQVRHYYLAGGLILPFDQSRTIIFKPSFLVKNSNLFGEMRNNNLGNVGAPTEFDIDLSFLFYEALWIGASFRSAFEGFNGDSSYDSADLWVAYFLRNGFRVGASFDYTLTELRPAAQGSFELVLGYEFSYKESAILTPRYFF